MGRPASQRRDQRKTGDERGYPECGMERGGIGVTEREGTRERERGRKTKPHPSEGARVRHHQDQADADDGRPCLVTSPGRLDGIHLFVRPLPAPFAD